MSTGQAQQAAPPALWWVRLRLASRSLRENWSLFVRTRIGLIGLVIIGLYALLAAAHPILMNTVWEERIYDPVVGYAFDETRQPAPPSLKHPLGTDPLGRDILSQLMFSARSEFLLGLLAATVTVVIGTTVGAVAAYFGGVVDTILMRLADIMIMMPAISVLIVLSALIGVEHLELALIIGILSGFGGTGVVLKSQALSVVVKPYIDAARTAGGGHFHIILVHVVPNLLPLSFLYMMFTVTSAIFSEAVLSFLGLLDVRMSWGLMIHTTESAGYLLQVWGVLVADIPGQPVDHAAVLLLLPRRPVAGRGGEPKAQKPMTTAPVLVVDDLKMHYTTRGGVVRAVDGVSFSVGRGQSLGLVGESGCGKSSIAMTLLKLLPDNARLVSGSISLNGVDLVPLGEDEMRAHRWDRISMVFQAAMNSLDPVYRVGDQIVEALEAHSASAGRDAMERVRELFDLVSLDPSFILRYPHEYSGGMRQRAIIAMALACEPDIMIADEPTTALDVIVQDRILREMQAIQRSLDMSMIYISHDMAVIAEVCDVVGVMYAGKLVEFGPTRRGLRQAHPSRTRAR